MLQWDTYPAQFSALNAFWPSTIVYPRSTHTTDISEMQQHALSTINSNNLIVEHMTKYVSMYLCVRCIVHSRVVYCINICIKSIWQLYGFLKGVWGWIGRWWSTNMRMYLLLYTQNTRTHTQQPACEGIVTLVYAVTKQFDAFWCCWRIGGTIYIPTFQLQHVLRSRPLYSNK